VTKIKKKRRKRFLHLWRTLCS